MTSSLVDLSDVEDHERYTMSMADRKPLRLIKMVEKPVSVCIKAGVAITFSRNRKIRAIQSSPLNIRGITAYKSLKKDRFLIHKYRNGAV